MVEPSTPSLKPAPDPRARLIEYVSYPYHVVLGLDLIFGLLKLCGVLSEPSHNPSAIPYGLINVPRYTAKSRKCDLIVAGRRAKMQPRRKQRMTLMIYRRPPTGGLLVRIEGFLKGEDMRVSTCTFLTITMCLSNQSWCFNCLIQFSRVSTAHLPCSRRKVLKRLPARSLYFKCPTLRSLNIL